MTTSQNGWSASSDKSAIGIESPQVPGTSVSFPQGIRKGDVTTVLMYVASQFSKTVEPLRAGQCWGYDYKGISGSTDLSNHASGTALDFNAPSHPMGSRGTFGPSQVTAIRAILNYCEGAVRWGGDYDGRKDEMHFEINANAATVARIAAKIKGTSTSQPPTGVLHRTWPSYMGHNEYFGLITGPASSHGGYYANERPDVKAIQQRLIALGYVPGVTDQNSGWADGKFEGPTKNAVSAWQHAKYSATTSKPGEVWSDDWAHLFTY